MLQVEDAVLAALLASGVALSRGCELEGWRRGEVDWEDENDARALGQRGQGARHLTHVTLRPKQGAALRPLREAVKKVRSVILEMILKCVITSRSLHQKFVETHRNNSGILTPKGSDEEMDELAPLIVPCLALFCFGTKAVDPITFSGEPGVINSPGILNKKQRKSSRKCLSCQKPREMLAPTF